ncbi:MAG: hypothetical protein Roseis2KO_34920 [Roseivirga sp.]
MKRRDFIQKSLISSAVLASMPVIDLFSTDTTQNAALKKFIKPTTDPIAIAKMGETLNWMRDHGWQKFINDTLNINQALNDQIDLSNLEKKLDNLDAILKQSGMEDFAGDKLIEPGSPSLSLLYHILASARVNPENVGYPELEQLDALENYIYSFIDASGYLEDNTNKQVFLAVLAYEFRPASKVPPFADRYLKKEYAQTVYSRTGISRIGNKDHNYDKKMRSFTNLPATSGEEKHAAVHPARYGLFLVELLPWYDFRNPNVQLMNQQEREALSRRGGDRYFINPIKKISQTEQYEIEFGEYHINEKLLKLKEYRYKNQSMNLNPGLDFTRPPFIRVSAKTDNNVKLPGHKPGKEMVEMKRKGDSVLLASIPAPLIREAVQDEQLISLTVPESWKIKKPKGDKVKNKLFHVNRRHSSLKMPNAEGHEIRNVVMADLIGRRKRRTSSLRSPKISPLFVNIKYEVKNRATKQIDHIDGRSYKDQDFEKKIKQGDYQALLFEDSICDGCISAKLKPNGNGTEFDQLEMLPAFSLVTAPDFFPFIDSNDLRAYYYSLKKVNTDQDFFEGGTINLSGLRIPGNPAIQDPFRGKPAFASTQGENKSFDTLTAVISSGKGNNTDTKEFSNNYDRDYKATSFLPDTGTGIFFPGWEATYSGDKDNMYLATYGLGSPFVEDMKLCAAANGMWPVSSPDSGRTFQGSMEDLAGLRPNTATPLLDHEIGLNKYSPYVRYYNHNESFGWDGEQGPYIEYANGTIYINYTDIGRADYLQNVQDPQIGFDLSRVRDLEAPELIHRMDCFRNCIRQIDNKKVWRTKLWLVGAEKVEDWSQQQNFQCLPKEGIFNTVAFNTAQTNLLKGAGYFYVIIKADDLSSKYKGELDPKDELGKRLTLPCAKVWLCQVTRDALAYYQIKKGKAKPDKWTIKNLG